MKEKECPFNEKDVRLHYRLLNHRHLTELRILKRGMYPICRIVKDENSFVSVCRQWNGKRNVYVGLRDRMIGLTSCARAENIVGFQSLVLDIDPLREPETPATMVELHHAINVAKIAKTWCKENRYQEPCIAITGNGCCLYFFVPFYTINPKNRAATSSHIENFEHYMRNTFSNELREHRCMMDRMYDLPRIIRVIGTYNIKGTRTVTRHWRLSYWLGVPKRQDDEKLLKFVLSV